MTGKFLQKINSISSNINYYRLVGKINRRVSGFINHQSLDEYAYMSSKLGLISNFNNAVKIKVTETSGLKPQRITLYSEFINNINSHLSTSQKQKLGSELNLYIKKMFDHFKNSKNVLNQEIKQAIEVVSSNLYIS